jgi:hypothetical protein
VFQIHKEADGVAACATAKAVIELFLGLYAEGWGFFLMERAAGAVVLALFLQAYSFIDDIDNISAMQ